MVACPLSLEAVTARVRWVDQALSAADYRARDFKVETDQQGLVNVITPPERAA